MRVFFTTPEHEIPILDAFGCNVQAREVQFPTISGTFLAENYFVYAPTYGGGALLR